MLLSLLMVVSIARQREKMRRYEYIFIALQLLNLVTQSVCIVYESSTSHNDSLFNFLQFFTDCNGFGVILVNLQTLTLFAVLDSRITPRNIRLLGSAFALLFLVTTPIMAYVGIDYTNSDMLLRRVITAGSMIWMAVGLIYDNIQAAFFIWAVYAGNKVRKSGQIKAVCTCNILQKAIIVNTFLGGIASWAGVVCYALFAFGTWANISPPTWLVSVAAFSSGLMCTGVVYNFYRLRDSALGRAKRILKQKLPGPTAEPIMAPASDLVTGKLTDGSPMLKKQPETDVSELSTQKMV
ncbi:hypothetical protein HDU91_006634 [Kappamyces sp. JEL0680]|nr:hypothetical protein HDU91_006634 [Kappamyces sp. JEL0680]